MPNINNWLGSNQDSASFAADRIVNRDQVALVLARGATDLDAQYVRVVPNRSGSEGNESQANNTPSGSGVVVIGDSDLNIAKGDLFTCRSTRYKVVYVMSAAPGHIQAYAEGTQ